MVSPVVVIVHELGHVLAGKSGGGTWHWTAIVPLGIVLFGLTKMSGVRRSEKAKMYRAGPIAGVLASVAFVIAGLLFCLREVVGLAVVAAGMELYQLVAGRDARMARRLS